MLFVHSLRVRFSSLHISLYSFHAYLTSSIGTNYKSEQSNDSLYYIEVYINISRGEFKMKLEKKIEHSETEKKMMMMMMVIMNIIIII